MGNIDVNVKKSQTILEKYEFVSKLSQDKKVYKHKQSSEQYLAVERYFATNEMLMKYESKMRTLLSIQHPYFLNQTEHAIMTVSTICSIQHKVMHLFEYQRHYLQNELKTRYQHKKYFQQKQIWSILCSCVLAMSHLTKNNISHFCIHPRDIMIDNLGMIKILSPLLSENNDQIINEDLYYSPEHMKSLKNNQFHTLNNKSSVFTLGITLIYILLLQPMNDVFNYENCTIRMDLLYQKIEAVPFEQMKEIIKKMLIPQSYDRISFTQLQQMLYNILETNNEDNSNINNYNSKISKNNINHQQPENQQSEKLKQSIYQIQRSKGYQQFDRFSKIQDIHLNKLPNDEQDLPSVSVQSSEHDKQKVDEQDIIIKQQFYEKNTRDQFLYTQIGSIHTNQQSLKDIKCFNASTHRIALQQIKQNSRLANVEDQTNESLVETKKLKKNNDSLNSLNSLNSLRQLGSSKLRTEQNNHPYHVRQQLTRGFYQGYKLDKMRHGYGIFTYSEGGKYAGQWNKNKMQGRGALYYANGQIAYEGEWKDDKLFGYGVLYNEIPTYFYEEYDFKALHLTDQYWVKYEGNFVQDLKNGEGTLFLANGQYYRGYFQDDLPHGNGIYRCLNGKIIKGNWILGICQGI